MGGALGIKHFFNNTRNILHHNKLEAVQGLGATRHFFPPIVRLKKLGLWGFTYSAEATQMREAQQLVNREEAPAVESLSEGWLASMTTPLLSDVDRRWRLFMLRPPSSGGGVSFRPSGRFFTNSYIFFWEPFFGCIERHPPVGWASPSFGVSVSSALEGGGYR